MIDGLIENKTKGQIEEKTEKHEEQRDAKTLT